MTICDTAGCQEHYGCRLRNKGIQLSPRATMSRSQNWVPRKNTPSSIDGQIMYDERPGGIKMPYIGTDGQTIRHRQWAENKEGFAEQVRNQSLLTSTIPQGAPPDG